MKLDLDTRKSVRLLALAALGVGVACRSAAPLPEGEPLPFHVALIPTEIHDSTVLTATPSEPVYPVRSEEPADDDMRLELGSEELSRVLEEELGRVFVRTTLLSLPADAAQLAAASEAERERYWQEQAHAVGADLLVRTRLIVDPKIDGDRNDKFWLNVPLWLMLGGPLCWFVSDRTYEFSARLQAEVFDTSQGHETLSDYTLLPIPLYAEFQGVDLTLIQRADDGWDYALSIVCPAGLLAKDTEDVEEELEERLPVHLGRELAHKVLAERSQFEQNLALGAFKLEAQSASLAPGADGRTLVRVPVSQLAGESTLHRYEIAAGDTQLASGNFEAQAGADGKRMIEEDLSLPAGAEYLKVRVVDADLNTRSYTIRVAPANR